MMRVWIVDDEELAVRRLARMLRESGRVIVAGSSTDPVAAVSAIRDADVDAVFLDIQMPGLDGFAFLEQFRGEPPLVVFTTAWHEYAVKAFEVNSVDYLLKPVEAAQLDRALGKLARMAAGSEVRPDVNALMNRLATALEVPLREYPTRLPSRTGDRVEFVDVRTVSHFYAKDKLTFAATDTKDYSIDGSIVDLEGKLDPRRFVRIHRSTLVNLDYIQEMYNWFGGKVLVRLRDAKKTELTVSRERVRELKERLQV